MFFYFFFQAEDGIRDYKVTGVQTCALPISSETRRRSSLCTSPRRCSSNASVSPTSSRPNSSRRVKRTGGRCRRDRKSTRLNSSHLVISYAVFCLKKKKKNADTAQKQSGSVF